MVAYEGEPAGPHAVSSTNAHTDPGSSPSLRRTAAATFIGTTIEWYDFFIYSTAAALVFGPQFFPDLSPSAGLLASFATFGVAFVARPFGGVLFGHLGDRLGRKRMLVASLTLMGAASFGIGMLPTYETIGLAAPILLVLLRLLQGIAVGGEWGGAVLMAMEHAPPNRRGRYAGFPQMGVAGGLILSSSFALFLSYTLSNDAYLDWAWRLPFLASFVLVVVGIVIRLKLEETPEFQNLVKSAARTKNPTVSLLRTRPLFTLLAAGAYVGTGVTFYIASVYLVSYAAGEADLSRRTVLAALLVGAASLGIFTWFFSLLSDRIGPGRVLLIGAGTCAAMAFPLIAMVSSTAGLFIGLGLMAAFNAALYAPLALYYANLFPTEVRYSGVSIAYQGGAVVSGAFAPLIAVWLEARLGLVPIALYIILACAITAFSVSRTNQLPSKTV